jgi:hypothetical protein
VVVTAAAVAAEEKLVLMTLQGFDEQDSRERGCRDLE